MGVPEDYTTHDASDAAEVTAVCGHSALLQFKDGTAKAAAVELKLRRINVEEPVPVPRLLFDSVQLADTINALMETGIKAFGPLFAVLVLARIPDDVTNLVPRPRS